MTRLNGQVRTNAGGPCIQAVLDQLFGHRAQVNDNLARLNLVYLIAQLVDVSQ